MTAHADTTRHTHANRIHAARRIGCTIEHYLAQRAAGLAWCSHCRSWQQWAGHNTCRPCRARLARERDHSRGCTPRKRYTAQQVLDAYAASRTAGEMSERLQCSERHAHRLVRDHGLEPFGRPSAAPTGPTHPPAKWCSCEWCVKARGRAA